MRMKTNFYGNQIVLKISIVSTSSFIALLLADQKLLIDQMQMTITGFNFADVSRIIIKYVYKCPNSLVIVDC